MSIIKYCIRLSVSVLLTIYLYLIFFPHFYLFTRICPSPSFVFPVNSSLLVSVPPCLPLSLSLSRSLSLHLPFPLTLTFSLRLSLFLYRSHPLFLSLFLSLTLSFFLSLSLSLCFFLIVLFVFSDPGSRELVWATSWGVSTRLIGAMVMSHSDDKGTYIRILYLQMHFKYLFFLPKVSSSLFF